LKTKRHKILTNIYDYYKYKKLKLEGKEVFLENEGEICSPLRNKYAILIWGPDPIQEPHFHVIDTETLGNTINWSYSMITGKSIEKHGSNINPLSNQIISTINRMLNYDPVYKGSRDNHLIMIWNSLNKKQFKKKTISRLVCN